MLHTTDEPTMSNIKRLDVPLWVQSEKRYYNSFGSTRRLKQDNESFDDYQSRMIEENGYERGIVMFPGREGYFLIGNLLLIQYNGMAWISLDKDKVNLFKRELKNLNLPCISSEVFKSLEVLARNGFLKYNTELYQLYNLHSQKIGQWKWRKQIESQKRKRYWKGDT